MLLITTSCSREASHKTNTPSAKQLLYGVLRESGLSSPDLVFSYGDDEYEERFETLYNIEISCIEDGAVAISGSMSADEIAILEPSDKSRSDEIAANLKDHVAEELSVYEKYSPADTANLKNALIFNRDGFVILIVSSECDLIEGMLQDYLNHPETLPAIPTDEATESTTSTDIEPLPTESTGDPDTAKNPEISETTAPFTNTATETETETEAPPVTDVDTEKAAVTNVDTEKTPVTEQNNTSSTEPDLDHVYAYDNELPEREAVGDDFFSDAVFIGDSRFEDLVHFNNPKCAAAYTYTSLSVSAVFTKNLVETKNGTVTIADALKKTKFSKCYLMFGLNELGWPYADVFIKRYVKVIDLVRSVNPDADIYIINIYPSTAWYTEKHPDKGNKIIKERNDLLAEMAKEYNLKLLNAAAALCNKNGVLPDDASSDGVHGNKATCRKLYEYMHTHY